MVKIGLIKHMTHSFAVLELSEILVNIVSRSYVLVITLSSTLPPIFSDLAHYRKTFLFIFFRETTKSRINYIY